MINVIICDDNDKDRQTVVSLVKDFMYKNKIDFELHVFNDYDTKFNNIIEKKIPSKIYLLDIETPSGSGIDIARRIRRKDIDSQIIFLTGHEELGNIVLKSDLAFLAFINKFDNLKHRLNKTMRVALDLIGKKSLIKFSDRNVLYTILLNDILYITKDSFERKTVIKTDYSEFKVNNSLSEIVSMLDDRFIQTHRSCYINLDRASKIDKADRLILFDNGECIDLLSDKYKKDLVK